MSVLRVSRPSLADEVYAEFRAWPKVRYALYSVFNNCGEVGRMTALYGQRNDEQIREALEYANGS